MGRMGEIAEVSILNAIRIVQQSILKNKKRDDNKTIGEQPTVY